MPFPVGPKISVCEDDLVALISHQNDLRRTQIAKVVYSWFEYDQQIRYARIICVDGEQYAFELYSQGNKDREIHPPPRFYLRRPKLPGSIQTAADCLARDFVNFARELRGLGRQFWDVARDYETLFQETFPMTEKEYFTEDRTSFAEVLTPAEILRISRNMNGSSRNGHTLVCRTGSP